MRYRSSRSRSFFERKGFYVALSLSLVAIGAAGWVGFKNVMPSYKMSSGASSSVTSGVLAADNTVSNIPATSSRPDDKDTASGAGSSGGGIIDGDDKGTANGINKVNGAENEDEGKTEKSENSETVDTAAPKAPFFVLPLTGTVMKPYSDKNMTYSLTMKDWRMHAAIDIEGTIGDKINAAGDGVVKEIKKDDPSWGTVLVIDHGNGVIATYAGLKSVIVKEGDKVYANDKVGTLGEIPCEVVEAVHLHFEMKKDGKPVSPLKEMGLID